MSPFRHSFATCAWILVAALALNACGGGKSGGSTPAPAPTATTVHVVPSPSAAPSGTPNPAAFFCPSSNAATSAVVAGRRSAAGEGLRRITPRRSPKATLAPGATQLIAVTYDARTAGAQRSTLGTRESALGASLVRSYAFNHAALVTRVLRVPTASVTQVQASLRQQPGVRAVTLTGVRRNASSVTTPYFPNDPYFTGFQTTTAVDNGAIPPATYLVPPLQESADVPGQWDMHVTGLEYAFGYSQPNNGSSVGQVPAALGSSSVKLAIIDTGEDITHPELASKIAYQKCFLTNLSGTQTTSNFTVDEDGHGTDVAGIAGAATGNGLGFTAAGGNVKLYAYRVFPTPDDSCVSDTSTSQQCGTDPQDIAAAINDAVAQNVNVISMSLGGGSCTNGQDSDAVEGAAVADAIAANIVVVAAAGNGSGPPVEAPACDTGVIAVGATALSDGSTNATGNTAGSAASPHEYVASYTDYGLPGAAINSSAAWGIVAPGGDPSGSSDGDNLHWIENIWTTTPLGAAAGDTNFAGTCSADYSVATGTTDCRVLIAGTSMATPHVAGAAALIISVNPSYQSPAAMKQLLCSTAADISDANEGCGRLDVYRAMATALGDSPIPASSPIP